MAGDLPAADLEAAVERSEPYVRPLSGERIFVTGGTGFVGTWLLGLLLRADQRLNLGTRVVVLTRDPDAYARSSPRIALDDRVELVRGDVRDFEFPTGTYGAVIHGAASSDDAWNLAHPAEAVDTIVSGTLRTLAFARRSGARRFLLLSSGAVYGRQPAEVGELAEDHAGAPPIAGTAAAAYGQAKRIAEILALLGCSGALESVTARIFSCYGPYLPLSSHFAIGNFIRDALLGRPVTVLGDGSPVRTYLYGADLAVGLLACIARGEAGCAYNIGGDRAITMSELARLVGALADPPVPVRILGEPVPSSAYVPDISRARRILGFGPAVALEQGLRSTVVWARESGRVK